MSLGGLTKLPAMVFAWEVFVMLVVVVVVFTSLEVFHSLLFDVISHPSVSYRRVFTPIIYFQPSSSQSDLRHFHFNLSWLFRHIFTVSATVLSGRFIPTGIFYLTLLSHIFGTFCNSAEGRNTPSRILLCACSHRVVRYGWRMDLNYSYCGYKTIDLSIAPVSHEV